jgi:hypothetical protein
MMMRNRLRETSVVRTRLLKLILLLGLVNREMIVQVCDRKVVHLLTEHREKIWEVKTLQPAGQVNPIVLVVGLQVI